MHERQRCMRQRVLALGVAVIVEHPHIKLPFKTELVDLLLVMQVVHVLWWVGGVGGTEGWVEREARCGAVVGCP